MSWVLSNRAKLFFKSLNQQNKSNNLQPNPISPRYWAVVPAAGIGQRMLADRPKQYLPLADGRCVLEQTVLRLLAQPEITAVVVAIAEADPYWKTLAIAQHPRIHGVPGGLERGHSVRNALAYLADGLAGAEDWVLVHDAARPCLHPDDINQLLVRLHGHPVGGLLGVPVQDTMKRTDAQGTVTATVDRQALWHAFTPQMFRLSTLLTALNAALAANVRVTDEASAIEFMGLKPQLIAGRRDNIKITHPQDLALAAFYLQQQTLGA